MSHSSEIKIQVVILMKKYESPVMVIDQLQRRGTINVPEMHPITSIYHQFVETGSARDLTHTGRSLTSK